MNAVTTRGSTSLAPQSFGEAVEFSKMLARSGMVPKDYVGKPDAVMVALQWGAEVGLSPLQALNGISIINGKPSLWGDAALALVRGHPACAGIREGCEGDGDAMFGFCEITRRGEAMQRRTFSVPEAKKAGLWGKSGPWQQYPARMLQMRARGFAIRDVFPDALRGVITREEADDMPAEPRDVPNLAREVASSPLPEPPPLRAGLPIIAPDGSLRHVSKGVWLSKVAEVLDRLQTAESVADWGVAMVAHITTAGETDEIMAAEAVRLTATRMAEFTEHEGE